MKSRGECEGCSLTSGRAAPAPPLSTTRLKIASPAPFTRGMRLGPSPGNNAILVLSIAFVIAVTDARIGDRCPNEPRYGMQGVISSPNYPLPYDLKTCRQWFIQGDQHDVITISFQDLDLPTLDPVGCEGDSFVHLGPDPDVFFCGTLSEQVPRVYISKKSHVWVKFIGSGLSPGRGFDLKYIRGPMKNREPCLSDEFRCNSTKCILGKWHCNGADECGDNSDEEGCRAIQHLSTPGPWDCGKERFGCFDVVSKTYVCHWIFRLCDNTKDCSDGKDERHCDQINRVCGGALNGPSGAFSSPNYPGPYPNSVHCEWLIHVTYGRRIQLRFKVFVLENHYDTDYVVVYDGGSDRADSIGSYYGDHQPPSLIESTGNRLFVQFVSNKDSQEEGFQATFQVKGHCVGAQQKCGYGEDDCYWEAERCDGKWNCREHGGDERGCGQCGSHLFQCMAKGTQCYPESEHCNGISHCSNNKDELDCTPQLCGPHNGTFLCESRQCIYESWRCDNAEDCEDGSDEANCTQPSVKVITAAVIGSLICGLLLVIAIGCTCKLYALRLHEAHVSSRISTPISRLTEELFARRLAPPTYSEAMLTSRSFEDAQREFLNQLQGNNSRRFSGHRRSRHSRSNQGRSVSTQSQGQGSAETHPEDASQRSGSHDNDVALIDISEPGSGGQQLDTTGNDCVPIILSSDCDGDDSDSNCDPTELSNVNISIATGISAQWRRGRRKTCPSSSSTEPSPIVGRHQGDLGHAAMVQEVHDCASIETASASTNSVIISLDGDNSKVDEDDDDTPASLPPANQSSHIGSCDRECSDGESDSSDSADIETEESLVLVDIHSDTIPLVSR